MTANMSKEWKDLNVSMDLAPHLEPCDALRELVMNAFDAVPDGVPMFSAEDSSTVVLQDQGPGLTLKSFTVGGTHGDMKVVGRFGLGLKDAVAVLMRHQAKVEIISQLGSYDFEVRMGKLGTETIHVQCGPPTGAGTRITVSNLQVATRSVEYVKPLFLCWSRHELLHTSGDVDMYLPNDSGKKHCGKLFVNGVAVTAPQSLHLSYNFKKVTSEQRKAYNRDHNVEGPMFTKHFMEPIKEALLSFDHTAQPIGKAVPLKATCEFAWNIVREKYFPEAMRAPILASRAEECQQAAANEVQSLCRQLADLAELPAPPKFPSRPSSPCASSGIPLLSEKVTSADINRLIDSNSRDDTVPDKHKNIVSRITRALQVRSSGTMCHPCLFS